jgi:hypothetical protein
MQNWDSLWQNDGLARDPKVSFVGIAALQRALGRSLPCLVDAPTGMRAQRINATAFKLQWTLGKDADTQTVLASAAPVLIEHKSSFRWKRCEIYPWFWQFQ